MTKEKTFIFVRPSYNNLYEYTINDGQMHCLEEKEMFEFLKTFITLDKYNEVYELLRFKDNFVLDGNTKTIYKLSYKQNEKEFIKQLKENNFQNSIKEQVSKINFESLQEKKQFNIDNFLNNIANKEVKDWLW